MALLSGVCCYSVYISIYKKMTVCDHHIMEEKFCRGCNMSITIEARDFEFYDKMGIQAPPYCPDCRFKRRALWRNERTLYRRTCQMEGCGKSIITMYHERNPHPVYCNDCWFSDKWDARDYGLEYDTSRPFFDQLGELLRTVPQTATYASNAMGPNINSEYTNFAGANKDCYLIFNSGPSNENVGYSRGLMFCKDSYDLYFARNIERCYDLINSNKCAGVRFGHNVTDCLDSWFLMNCSGCSNCFGCVNLRNGQYQFFNEQLSKEEYRARVEEIVGSHQKIEEAKRKFYDHILKFPLRANQNLKSVNSDGDYLMETKDCHHCFEVGDAENVSYAFSSRGGLKDCMDVLGHGRKTELMHDVVDAGLGSRIVASWWSENSNNIEYSFAIRGSVSDALGCVSIKNAKFCILNKQYPEEDYRSLREHIVNELKELGVYGSFIPPTYAFFAYNETVGQDNLPMSKDEALAQGFKWEDNLPETRGQETLTADQIPDNILVVTDGILKETLACINCGRNYRLTPAELAFYRDMSLPVPRVCWNCRFTDRIHRRGPMKLYGRTCAKCNKEIKTSFAPRPPAPDGTTDGGQANRPEIVYCEQCYQQEVV